MYGIWTVSALHCLLFVLNVSINYGSEMERKLPVPAWMGQGSSSLIEPKFIAQIPNNPLPLSSQPQMRQEPLKTVKESFGLETTTKEEMLQQKRISESYCEHINCDFCHTKTSDDPKEVLHVWDNVRTDNGIARVVMCDKCCQSGNNFKFLDPNSYHIDYTIASKLIENLAMNMDQNFVVSPFTMDVPLSILFLGGIHDTEKQFTDLTHAANTKTMFDLYQSIVNDYSSLKVANSQVQLNVASKLWVNKNVKINKEFESQIRQGSKDGTMGIELLTSKEAVNQWVSKITEGKITELMQDNPSPATSIVLTSATFFNGKFAIPFESGSTWPRQFHTNINYLNHGSSNAQDIITVNMMKNFDHFPYFKDVSNGFEMIKLEYKQLPELKASLVIVKPLNRYSWHHPLSPEQLFNIEFISQKTFIYVPKFKFKTRKEMKDVLIDLGLKDAFSSANAKFDKIYNNGPAYPLYISSVIHEATIEVDEAGTIASAATLMELRAGAGPPSGPIITYPVFMVDQPFHAYVIDELRRVVLFFAMIQRPTEK